MTTILLLIKISYIDYKQKIIPDKLNSIIALLGIFNLILKYENCKIYIASAAITFAVFLLLAVLTDGGIGGGDIKLFTALGFTFGIHVIEIICFTFLTAGVYSIYLVLIKKQKFNSNIALGPFILVGTVISLLFPML